MKPPIPIATFRTVNGHSGRSMAGMILVLLSTAFAEVLSAQHGPLSPSTAVNDNTVGTHPWSNPPRVVASNDSRATVATRGISQYLRATNFGFNIAEPATITGIHLEIERSTSAVNNVALLNGWTTGLSRTLSAGNNRCLIVVAAMENGDGFGARDIIAMTYGGRPMTPLTETTIGGGSTFSAKIEVWMMLEADLALASGTTITRTYAASPGAHAEYCEVFSSAIFQHVDQLTPVFSMQSSGAQAGTNPHQLGASINTLAGSMAVHAVLCGNNSTPGVTNGGTNTYTINSSYTEGTDIYFANTATAPATGASLQTAHKAISMAGTERPTCTFNGSVNRHTMVGFTLQRARELDHSVRLVKSGTVVGEDRASTSAWTTTDTYISYGGPVDPWGETWTVADVNDIQFGAALSTRVQSGTARVDHMRLTVYAVSTLPVELVHFHAEPDGAHVRLTWTTATERDNERFVVQRSRDALEFEDVTDIPGAGHSQQMLHYVAYDERPLSGITYYRLQQMDLDGTVEYSPVVVVTRSDEAAMVYPNPTEGHVTIRKGHAEHAEVSILNSQLQVVRTAHLAQGDPMLYLGDLPDGMYLLLLRTPAGTEALRVVKASRSH